MTAETKAKFYLIDILTFVFQAGISMLLFKHLTWRMFPARNSGTERHGPSCSEFYLLYSPAM
jgi:hypothetical protein